MDARVKPAHDDSVAVENAPARMKRSEIRERVHPLLNIRIGHSRIPLRSMRATGVKFGACRLGSGASSRGRRGPARAALLSSSAAAGEFAHSPARRPRRSGTRSQPDRRSQQNCEIREAASASHEPPDRILPTLLKALERVLAGGLHVVPGGLVGVPDLLKKLACFLGVGLQLSDAALVLGARLHARLPYLRLIFLDLRLPGIDLVLQLFRKV